MIHQHSPRGAVKARRGRPFARLIFGAALAVSGFSALTTGAVGPGYGNVLPPQPDMETASLSFSGDDVIITGSVDHIFESQSFVGPNKGAKQDRPRISVDVADFSAAFNEGRQRLAALRHEDTPATSKIAIASLGPVDNSAALAAINEMAPDQTMPMPAAASEKLAYARANEPATDFAKPTNTYSEKEQWCMATAIYFEARGESYRGQVAVAQVVMNRMKHKLYPSTACGVVFQNQNKRNACQFSFACDGRPETVSDKKAWAQAEEITDKVMAGELYLTDVGNATHYHATYVYPHWAPKMTKLTKVGLHVFYRFKRGWSFG